MALEEVELLLPFAVADYVDFYSSLDHATNVGRMFRPGAEPLLPNWRHMPIGYHGRAGTVVVERDADPPAQRPAPRARRRRAGLRPERAPRHRARAGVRRRRAERAGRAGGRSTPRSTTSSACVLVNDWSARDIQAWEYRPLGPFLAKSFATSMAAWVTPLAAVLDRRVAAPAQEPAPLHYLREDPWALDLDLEIELNGSVDRAHERPAPVLVGSPAARAPDGQRRVAARRRPLRLGHHLGPRARAARLPARAGVERGRADRARRRVDAQLPARRRRGRPARAAEATRWRWARSAGGSSRRA